MIEAIVMIWWTECFFSCGSKSFVFCSKLSKARYINLCGLKSVGSRK
jgi:hypothetical protein